MRKWTKYALGPSGKSSVLPIDQSLEDHAKAMGGYQPDSAYQGKPDFFNQYLYGYQFNRLEHYDDFLRQHLQKNQEVLSLASGRCANELALTEDGYRITCSDIGLWDVYEKTKALFPSFEFIPFDILAGPAEKRYDSMICLSLIYLFDENELRLFFRNVSDSLKMNGSLLLDSAGAPDNPLATFIHDALLRCEVASLRIVKGLVRHRFDGWITKHHGYRRTDREIVEPARQCGLELRHQENYAFTTEFQRSLILNRLIASSSAVKRVFSVVGKAVPAIRMFKFEKVA